MDYNLKFYIFYDITWSFILNLIRLYLYSVWLSPQEENGEEATTSTATGLSGHRFPSAVYPQNYNSRCADITHTIALLRDAHDENPESILDDHVQRVMKTPGCLSPRAGWRSPRSCSPDRFPAGKATGPGKYLSSSQGKHPSRHPGLKGESSHHHQHKHVHHIHHAGSGKPREQAETEATVRVQSRSSADGMGSNPLEHPRSAAVTVWL